MPETWPATVPHCFTFDSLVAGLPDGRLRSQTDAGPAKVRRRSSAMPRPLAGQLVMTYAQWADLETFATVTTDGGALPFTFPSPTGGTDLLVRFGESLPTWRRYGIGKVMVDLQLEVLP
jgi:hypothetical protein